MTILFSTRHPADSGTIQYGVCPTIYPDLKSCGSYAGNIRINPEVLVPSIIEKVETKGHSRCLFKRRLEGYLGGVGPGRGRIFVLSHASGFTSKKKKEISPLYICWVFFFIYTINYFCQSIVENLESWFLSAWVHNIQTMIV